jgi:signal transduction histidine kinase
MSSRHRASSRRRFDETTDWAELAHRARPVLPQMRGPGPDDPSPPSGDPPPDDSHPGISRAGNSRPDDSGSAGRGRLTRGRTIRGKLALIFSVPTVLLVILAALGVINQYRVVTDAKAAAANSELVLATQDLINSFQQERGLTSGLLGGATPYRTQVDAQRRASDQNRATLDRLLASTHSPSTRAVRAALNDLNRLGSVRAAVDAGQIDRSSMLDFYTNAIVALSNASADASVGQDDVGLRSDLESLRTLGEAKEAIALERGQLNGVFAQGRFTQSDYISFTESRAAKLDALARFEQVATPQRVAALRAAQQTPEATFAAGYEERALGGAAGQPLLLSAPRWSAAMATVGYDLRAIQRDIGADTRARAAQVTGAADLLLVAYAAAAALTFLFALLLWRYTFRSIIRPLQVLTSEAREAAERRLPSAVARIQAAEEPSDVVLDSSASTLLRRVDEFAEVAEALDHLQQTAVRLAVDQAVMRHNTAESLANLGRRNQNLVRRQLGFISALEREEADPNALANLFELDHLATRMRRNAESLLVLVGEHSPRRWSGAVDVRDVLRSAFAEVEDYRRVILRRADEAKVQGTVAAELAHMLAELVENALSFSPPGQEVEVQARSSGDQYHIAIVDQGVGMSPEAMAVANARLRGQQSFLLTPARDLGHYVVGRLAQRQGIAVWLHDSPLTGVTARVVVPRDLIVKPERSAVAPPGAGVPAQLSGDTRRMRTEAGPVAGRVLAAAEPTRTGTALAVLPPAPTPDADTATTVNVAADGGGMATTRNGLVKRQPREKTRARPAGPAVPPPPPPAAEAERTPSEVGAMLDVFRSGVHRGEHRRTDEPQ